jgi:hypothetical protein
MGVIEERGLSYFSRQEDFRAIAEILADIEVENRDKAIERIITVVWAKDWKSKGKTVIQALLPSLSQTLRTELLETLIASSTRVADRCDRALALAELLQLIVPETERSDIARRALNALEHIDDSQKRAEALVKVAAEVSSAAPDVFIHFLFDWIDDSEIDTVMTAVLRQKSAIAASLLAGLIERAGIVSDPIFRSRLFCKILAVAPEDVNSESLFDEAVKSLTEVPDPLTRLRAYIDTFQTVPDRFKTRWLASASQSLDSLEDPLIALQLFTNRLDSSSWPEIGRIIELTSRDEYKRQFQIAIKQEKARRHEEAINRKAYGIQERFGFGRSSRNFEAAEEALTSHANLRSKSISVVNTGFCNEAGDMLEAGGRLLSGREYYFWLEISPLLPQSIEKKPTPLPPLPPDSELTVVLWEIDDGLRIREGSDIARLRVLRDGTAEVVKQPGFTPRATHEDLRRRAYFPLHISGCSGVQRFRCNIYCADALIQSRLIRALIVSQPTTAMGELSSEIDYAISRDLDPAYLRRLSPHQLSIMLSDETDANVSFAFFGASGAEIVKHESKFDPLELQDAIQQARNVLRSLAWGDEGDWNIGKKYRYSERIGPAQMRDDFVSLAIRGYRLYDMAIDRLSGGRERAGALANLMRKPGVVQIALNASPRYLMPVALMYDFNLDTGAPRDRYKLCSGFLAALGGKAPLRDSPCFSGACPSRIGDESAITICPGGFWGFRHRIGVPLSSESREAPAVIGCEGELRVAAARSTDPAFRLWAAHEKTLRAVFGETSWQCAESRSDALRLLKERDPHMVYFYCHGGTSGNIPYLQVGPLEDTVITRDNLRSAEIRWVKTRPLVFINGCNTAAVEPARGMEFVSALMGLAAAGVIGTDITLFEPLACAFAEECFRLFAGGFEIGEAIREARLALLKNGNPLGLLYTPYSLATLRLVRTPLQPS